MESTLADFVRVLRGVGVRVSIAETLDAYRALRGVGVSERGVLKSALAATLAKTQAERELFDGCFERFFSYQSIAETQPPEPPEQTSPDSADASAGPDDSANAASASASGQMEAPAAGAGAGALAQQILTQDWEAIAADIAAAGQRVGANNIVIFVQRGQYARAISEELGIRELDADIGRLDSGDDAEREIALRLEQGRQALTERIRSYLDRQIALFADTAYQADRRDLLPRIQLDHLERRDYAEMQLLVQRMATRLAALHGYRRKRARRGQLDLRRTLRSGLAYDGIPFQPRWRQRKLERPKVMALCDVSGSVAVVSRFMLMFLYSVGAVLPKVRSFAFCSDLYEVTELFAAQPIEHAVAETMRRYGERSSDYGRALADFEALCLDDIDHRTTVIILGDARSNYGDPGVDSLRRVYQRARQVLWLNPERRGQWGTGDSAMPLLASACHRTQVCNTLKDLERLVGDLLRTAV